MSNEHRRDCIAEWHPTRDDCTCGAWANTLATNLRWAAFGCAAFNEGAKQTAAEIVSMIGPECLGRRPWVPGCNRPAPGWAGE